LIANVTSWGGPEENCQKCVNTRENRLRWVLAIDWTSSGGAARSFVVPGSFSSRSFSLLKVSQKCSQLIHMRSFSASPAGLRLEIPFKIDKKKNEKREFYFSSRTKIFLTKKRNARSDENKKFRPQGCS
jgi:hypothetical protein